MALLTFSNFSESQAAEKFKILSKMTILSLCVGHLGEIHLRVRSSSFEVCRSDFTFERRQERSTSSTEAEECTFYTLWTMRLANYKSLQKFTEDYKVYSLAD